MEDLEQFSGKYGERLLRYSLGLVFLWFGLLKVFGASPVSRIILFAMPSFVADIPWFFLVLGLAEVAIGLGFFFRKTAPIASVVMILHLLVATISVLVTQGFSTGFPFLTIEGEFVIKNIVFIAAGIAVIGMKEKE